MSGSKPSIIIVVIILILLLASAYNATTISISRLSKDKQDVLTIGINTPYKPFEYKIGDEIKGIDIEISKKIGEKLERDIKLVDFTDFSAIFPALESGSIDMAISAITITSEREEIFNFSDSYYNTSQALLSLKKGNIKVSSTSLISSDFSGLRIGVQELTTSQSWVDENLNGTIKSNIVFGDLNMGIQNLRLGGIDGIVLDESVANTLVKDYPDLIVIGVVKTDEKYGIMIKKGDPDKLLPVINEVITEMKNNGEYDKLINKYFGGS